MTIKIFTRFCVTGTSNVRQKKHKYFLKITLYIFKNNEFHGIFTLK